MSAPVSEDRSEARTGTSVGARPEGMSAPVVHAIHENPEWFGPFAEQFEAQGVPYREWLLTGGGLDLSEPPPPGVYWSRFSASSHTRGHEHAKEHSRAVLAWAAAAGRRVVNGAGVLSLEVSKVLQLTALAAHGLEVPHTRVVVGTENLLAAAASFPTPFLTKHNQGGKGLGVRRYESAGDLAADVAEGTYPEPVDGVTLLQEYVPPAGGTITRVEIVGGEVVYAVSGDTARGGFQLCPADACAIDPETGRPLKPYGATIEIDPTLPLFSLREHLPSGLAESYLAFAEAHDIEIAGIEFLETADGRVLTYDVNTNTNYNPAVEAAAPRSGPGSIVS